MFSIDDCIIFRGIYGIILDVYSGGYLIQRTDSTVVLVQYREVEDGISMEEFIQHERFRDISGMVVDDSVAISTRPY